MTFSKRISDVKLRGSGKRHLEVAMGKKKQAVVYIQRRLSVMSLSLIIHHSKHDFGRKYLSVKF
jgi:hypothetical protein